MIEAVVESWHIKQRNTRRPMQCRTTRAHHINIVGYSSGTRSNVLHCQSFSLATFACALLLLLSRAAACNPAARSNYVHSLLATTTTK